MDFRVILLLSLCIHVVRADDCYTSVSGDVHCYYLYDNKVDWDIAYNNCQQYNQSLAIITSSEIHDHITTFLSSKNAPRVWTAGNRSDDNTWRYLYENPKNEMLDGTFPSRKYCAKMDPSDTLNIQSDDCLAEDIHALCQYSQDNGECEQGHVIQNGVCYFTSKNTMTWFHARNFCRDIKSGADLALGKPVFDESSKNADRAYWLALERRSWQWNSETAPKPFEYYAWEPSSGSNSFPRSCLALRSTDGSTFWSDENCLSHSSFVCETVSPGPVSPVVMTTTPSLTVTLADTSVPKPTVYIISTCVVVTVAAVVIIIIIFIRKRKLARKQSSQPRVPIQFPYPVELYNTSPNQTPEPVEEVPDAFAKLKNPNILPPVEEYPEINEENAYADISGYSHDNNNDQQTHAHACHAYEEAEIAAYATSNDISSEIQSNDSIYSQQNEQESNVVSNNEENPYFEIPAEQESDINVSSVSHVITSNGDAYALPRKNPDDLEDIVVDNPLYRSVNDVQV